MVVQAPPVVVRGRTRKGSPDKKWKVSTSQVNISGSNNPWSNIFREEEKRARDWSSFRADSGSIHRGNREGHENRDISKKHCKKKKRRWRWWRWGPSSQKIKKEGEKSPSQERSMKKRLQVKAEPRKDLLTKNHPTASLQLNLSCSAHLFLCNPSTLNSSSLTSTSVSSQTSAPQFLAVYFQRPVPMHWLFGIQKKIQFIFQSSSNRDLQPARWQWLNRFIWDSLMESIPGLCIWHQFSSF